MLRWTTAALLALCGFTPAGAFAQAYDGFGYVEGWAGQDYSAQVRSLYPPANYYVAPRDFYYYAPAPQPLVVEHHEHHHHYHTHHRHVHNHVTHQHRHETHHHYPPVLAPPRPRRLALPPVYYYYRPAPYCDR